MNPLLAIIITNIIWGAASPIFKYAIENIPPFTLAFIRFFFAGLIFLPFALRIWKKPTWKEWKWILLTSFLGISLNIAFFFLGLQRTASINAPIIASAGPIIIYFFSIVFLRERSNRKMLYGLIVSLIGVLIIILYPLFLDGGSLKFGEITGNIFLFIAMLGSVFNTIFGEKAMKTMNTIQVTCLTFIIGSSAFIPFMVREFRTWSLSQLNIHGWTGIIFGVFFSSALAYYLYYYAMKKIEAQEVGLIMYIDPVAAILIAMPLIGEYPNLYFFLGSILVFSGIFLAEGRLHWHPLHKLNMQSGGSSTR